MGNNQGHVVFKRQRGKRPANHDASYKAPPFYLDVFVDPLGVEDADPAVPNSVLEAIRQAILEDVAAFGGSSEPVVYSLGRVRAHC